MGSRTKTEEVSSAVLIFLVSGEIGGESGA
jgi:hypothetical protein